MNLGFEVGCCCPKDFKAPRKVSFRDPRWRVILKIPGGMDKIPCLSKRFRIVSYVGGSSPPFPTDFKPSRQPVRIAGSLE
jgi:hypothetical protein